ncbi:hypothetical protein LCO01nite_17140 [Lapidilactobacillus concavus]|uniref:type II toxin-antitoxin system RelB/DinJ family antitoxin n=1 Tax=Lapidilactobacillus concavus TaxID=287844 RepID=UPI00070D71FB|nr:type II toxin-antitoxin system RelB/DinJ family antitoxin [Lapidilactobacillus concavus]GEL14165.1 hypothetical protein LCO01nite_17140 [Lapidilactobacillus concavus]
MRTKDSTISVSVDSKLKKDVQQDLEKMGLDLGTYIVMSLKALHRMQELPFTPGALSPLEEAMAELRAGKLSDPISLEEYLKEVATYVAD